MGTVQIDLIQIERVERLGQCGRVSIYLGLLDVERRRLTVARCINRDNGVLTRQSSGLSTRGHTSSPGRRGAKPTAGRDQRVGSESAVRRHKRNVD